MPSARRGKATSCPSTIPPQEYLQCEPRCSDAGRSLNSTHHCVDDSAGRSLLDLSTRSQSFLGVRIFSSAQAARYSAARDVAANPISALCTGTHLDIAATDQIRPTATTTAIHPCAHLLPLCVA